MSNQYTCISLSLPKQHQVSSIQLMEKEVIVSVNATVNKLIISK